jgi:hypothetical protein
MHTCLQTFGVAAVHKLQLGLTAPDLHTWWAAGIPGPGDRAAPKRTPAEPYGAGLRAERAASALERPLAQLGRRGQRPGWIA